MLYLVLAIGFKFCAGERREKRCMLEVWNSSDTIIRINFSCKLSLFRVSETEGVKLWFMVRYLHIESLAAFNKATAELPLGADDILP
jgi:hypothetical protein